MIFVIIAVTDLSGLNEIIQWVQSDVILDPTQSAEQQYADISREFEKDNRSPLDDILLNDKEQFLEFLRSEQGKQPEPETEEELGELEQRADALERGINELSASLGVESIITRIGNFFKRLFR